MLMKKDKLNIAITAEFLCHSYFTGIENYLYNLIHSISSNSHINLTLICPQKTPRHLLPANANIYEHDPFEIFGTKFLSSLIFPPRNLNYFQIIHCPTVVSPFFFNTIKNANTKVVMTVHDLIPIIYPLFNILRRRIYFKYFLKYRFHYVDHFIVPSQSVKNDLKKIFKIKDNRIDVIYEGVSSKYYPINDKKHNYILAVSTLEPRKNFKRVIDCYIELKKNNLVNDKLIIVGKAGWYYKDILKIPENLSKNIIFKGYVSEKHLIELYQNAKVFVYPSLYEGFGLPVLEAMACGCPVITSKISSLPEVSGNAALLINPRNNAQLQYAMMTLCNDDKIRNIMIKKGKIQARRFSWTKCAAQTIRLYEKVLSN